MTPPMYTRDPIFGDLAALAYGAKPMTPAVWKEMKREFEHRSAKWRAERREPSRARVRHDRLPIYSRARLLA